MTDTFIIGNGESRLGLDLDSLREKGKIYGCNALYRDFVPDVLVAIDEAVMFEIVSTGYQKENQCYFKHWNLLEEFYYEPSVGTMKSEYDHVYETEEKGSHFVFFGTEKTLDDKREVLQDVSKLHIIWSSKDDKILSLDDYIDEDTMMDSGQSASHLSCKIDEPTDVYLIGFDMGDGKGKLNNVYKGTNTYFSPEAREVNPVNWVTQHTSTFDTFPDVTFHWGHKELKESYMIECDNLKHFNYREIFNN